MNTQHAVSTQPQDPNVEPESLAALEDGVQLWLKGERVQQPTSLGAVEDTTAFTYEVGFNRLVPVSIHFAGLAVTINLNGPGTA